MADLKKGSRITGVGATVPTVIAPMTITLGASTYELPVRILVPTSRAQRNALRRIPSLLGRDLIGRFTLFL